MNVVLGRYHCHVAEAKQVPPGSSFAYDAGLASLDEQRKRADALDSKAGILLAAAGLFAGFVFRGDSLLTRAPRAVGVSGAVLLIASIAVALLAFANRSYRSAPTPAVAVRMMAFPEDWLRWRFLGNVLEAVEVNRRKLRDKARLLTLAESLLLAAVGILGGYFIYALAVRGVKS